MTKYSIIRGLYSLKTHKMSVHEDKSKTFRCELCDKRFNQKSNLKDGNNYLGS